MRTHRQRAGTTPFPLSLWGYVWRVGVCYPLVLFVVRIYDYKNKDAGYRRQTAASTSKKAAEQEAPIQGLGEQRANMVHPPRPAEVKLLLKIDNS